ncbi:MAG: hypothetical protein ACRD5J_20505 [Nitrososphaeraceae archaeon]
MNSEQFRSLLKETKGRLKRLSDAEKILLFIEWCKKHKMEELILRLSSETRGGWGNNSFLDFTTDRLIVSKKNFFRKFVDVGYIAGMAPYPYLVLSPSIKDSEINKRSASFDPDVILLSNPSNLCFWYDEIEEMLFRRGSETTVHNMMGSVVQANFLTIKSKGRIFQFRLPARKDGQFDKVYYWISALIPVPVKAI